MLTFRTSRKAYRYCSLCKSRMTVLGDGYGLLVAICPLYHDGKIKGQHDIVSETPDVNLLYQMVGEIFSSGGPHAS